MGAGETGERCDTAMVGKGRSTLMDWLGRRRLMRMRVGCGESERGSVRAASSGACGEERGPL